MTQHREWKKWDSSKSDMSISVGVEVRVNFELDGRASSTTVVCPPNCVVSFLIACIGDALGHRLPAGVRVDYVVRHGERLSESAVIGKVLASDVPCVGVVFRRDLTPLDLGTTQPPTLQSDNCPPVIRPPRKRNRRVASFRSMNTTVLARSALTPATPAAKPNGCDAAACPPSPDTTPWVPTDPTEDERRTSSRQRTAPKHLQNDFELEQSTSRKRKHYLGGADHHVEKDECTHGSPQKLVGLEVIIDTQRGNDRGKESEEDDEDQDQEIEEEIEEGATGDATAGKDRLCGKVKIDDVEEAVLRRQLQLQSVLLDKMSLSLDFKGLGHGERKRLRNRQASRVSRLKKKLYVFDLQRRYNEELDRRGQCSQEVHGLRADVSRLLSIVQKHDPAFVFTPASPVTE